MNTSTTMTKVTFDLFGPCHTFDRPINNLVLGLLDAHVNTEQRVIVIIVVVVVVVVVIVIVIVVVVIVLHKLSHRLSLSLSSLVSAQTF